MSDSPEELRKRAERQFREELEQVAEEFERDKGTDHPATRNAREASHSFVSSNGTELFCNKCWLDQRVRTVVHLEHSNNDGSALWRCDRGHPRPTVP